MVMESMANGNLNEFKKDDTFQFFESLEKIWLFLMLIIIHLQTAFALDGKIMKQMKMV
jgi:hypothetical protein